MSGVPIYRTAIEPEWIDYNGHVRDAYYGLIVSYAIDSLMDRIGLDADYRKRSSCTLYTVEVHTHFLLEIAAEDEVDVRLRILAADPKRIHCALELVRDRSGDPAATYEVMLLHVRQTPEVRSTPFPEQVAAAIAELRRATEALPASGPGSRRMELITR